MESHAPAIQRCCSYPSARKRPAAFASRGQAVGSAGPDPACLNTGAFAPRKSNTSDDLRRPSEKKKTENILLMLNLHGFERGALTATGAPLKEVGQECVKFPPAMNVDSAEMTLPSR